MPDYTAIVKGIDNLTRAQEIQTSGILKSIEANAFVFNKELSSINSHLRVLNGTVARLQAESIEREKVVRDFRHHQKFGFWVHKNWWAVLLLFIASVTLIVVILDSIGLRGIWNVVKEVNNVL